MADEENKTDTSASSVASGPSGKNPETPVAEEQAAPGNPVSPPKRFWWRALLMIAIVIILFSTLRDLAHRQQPELTDRNTISTEIPALPRVEDGKVSVEEAPSIPPDSNIAPPPGYYYPPVQPYYPLPLQGGYVYPPADRWYPYNTPWYPPQYPGYSPYPPDYPAADQPSPASPGQ